MLAMLRKLRRNRRRAATATAAGFTMIELLMTMLILTIVLLGLAALQVGTIRRVTASRKANEAMRLSQTVLERYRHIGCDQLALRAPATGDWQPVPTPDLASTMTDVAGDGVNTGPYSVEQWVDVNGNDRIITTRSRWFSQDRDSAGAFKEYHVAVSLRRICVP